MPISVTDLIRTRVFCKQVDQVSVNVRYFRVVNEAGVTPYTDQQFVNDMSQSFSVRYKNLLIPTAQYFGIAVDKFLVSAWAPVGTSTFQQGNGVVSGNPLPRQVSGLIQFKTATPGPKGSGRLFIPFPSNSSSNFAGHPITQYVTDGNALGALYMAVTVVPVATKVFTLQGILRPAPPAALRDITTVFTPTKWATQRRRGDYGKVNADPF